MQFRCQWKCKNVSHNGKFVNKNLGQLQKFQIHGLYPSETN